MKAGDAVRVLGVFLTPDLALEKHVTTVGGQVFFSSTGSGETFA